MGRALRELLGAVGDRAATGRGTPIPAPGHFAGLVRLGRETIGVTTDTVGTKVLLAEELDRWAEVGEDLVAVNVNDLAAVGARPFGLVDTILCVRPDPRVFRAIGRGLDRGLAAARCPLLGGETAVVPEIVSGYDLGGTALGFFPRGRHPILGTKVRSGDHIVGLPSSGFHANGFTLLRRVLREHRVDLRAPRSGRGPALGVELLRPTRIYTRAADALSGWPGTHGLAHLSGGGVRNLTRLSSRVRFNLRWWPEPPPLFDWLQELGGVDSEEMFQTFNMGIGFSVIVAEGRLDEALRRLARAGVPDATAIGRVERGRGVSVPAHRLEYQGYR